MKALGLCFNSEFHTVKRVRTHLIDSTPQGKQLICGDKNTCLLKKVTRETCLTQHSGNRNSELLQLYGEPSRHSKMFEHPLLSCSNHTELPPIHAMQDASK